jgi:hypothetical protein
MSYCRTVGLFRWRRRGRSGGTWKGRRFGSSPTPAYTLTRRLRYAARYVLVDGVWPRLSENGARLALLYGRYLALLAKAGVAGESGWRYKIGDEEVDKSRLGQALLEQVKGALDAYGAAVRQLKGYGGTQQRWSGDFLTDL